MEATKTPSTGTSADTGGLHTGPLKDGIEVELCVFVPPGENVEIWRTTVRNWGVEAKDLSLFSYRSSASTRH